MRKLETDYLKSLRGKTGLNQSDLADKIGCARTTIIRWEQSGKIGEEHLAQLVALSRVADDLPETLPPRAGRPGKTYKVREVSPRQQAFVYAHGMIYYLWRPGHPDHCAFIHSPPVGIGDEWLERHADAPHSGFVAWFHWRRLADMGEEHIGTLLMQGFRLSIREATRSLPLPEHQAFNPRNWETGTDKSMRDLIIETTKIHGFKIPKGL